jgi:hypothetical protein
MPDAVVHGTLPTGAAKEIGATVDGRLEVDADFSDSSVDAFGRLRVSNPLTLFDSSHRFADNGLWSTSTATGGAAVFNANQGLVDLGVTASSGSKVYRETTKVFSYQPGKSLLALNTFVLNPAKTGLRQRVGYFGAFNGIYLELDDSTLYFCKRSYVSGSVVNTRVSQANWNIDKLDGSGPTGLTLDPTKAQIMWMDIEWLGVGAVRAGFAINNIFIHCHSFSHANIIDTTYITTASLPLRYEIENTAATASASTLKQICSTVISEGGYELRGLQQAVSIPLGASRTLGTAGTFYPVISIKLKASPNRLDAIVILTAVSAMAISNGNYNWQVRASGTTAGGTWVDAGANSAVEYNISGTSYSGGRILASGFFNASNQSATSVDILKEALFKFQLERNSFTSDPYELTLVIASDGADDQVVASMDFEEISR